MFMLQAAAESERLYTSSIGLSKDLLQRLMMDKCLEEDNTEDVEFSEEDVELSLGLSLGGCHKPKKTSNGVRNLQQGRGEGEDGGSGNNFGLQREGSHGGHGLGSGNNFEGEVEFDFGVKEESGQEEVPKIQDPSGPTQEMVEQQKKRELHARRRQEARKKREEKQLQRARRGGGGNMRSITIQSNKGRNGFVPLAPSYAPFPMRGGGTVFPMRVGGGSGSGVGVVSNEEDRRVLEAQMGSLKSKNRASKESEPCRSDRKDVKLKATEQGDGDGDPSIEDNRISHKDDNLVSSSNGGGNEVSAPCAALPMSYAFPVPMGMGFSFPYVMPYWPAAVDAPKSGSATPPLPPNVLQPIPSRAFPSFQMPVSQYADPKTQRGTGTTHSSSGRSSSSVSEYESRSSQGASSNDTKSQSSTSSAVERERLQRASSISKPQNQTMASSEVSTASLLEPLKSAEDKVPSNADRSKMVPRTTTMHEKKPSTKALQHGCASTAPNANTTEVAKDGQSQAQCPLPSMPCVSTTGEGGKTVNGFLYSYAKGEVSIVCVCHGTFLSPAEFVQHAGGTDILHPERHIVVNPSLSAMQDTSAMGEGI